jgi:hypothetical protein
MHMGERERERKREGDGQASATQHVNTATATRETRDSTGGIEEKDAGKKRERGDQRGLRGQR